MNNRLYLLILFAGLLSFGTVKGQWTIEKCPANNNLKAIFFTGKNSGWIVGDNGTLLHKAENSWITEQKPTSNNLNSIFMINEKDGWAVGGKGTIIHFNGQKWENIESPTNKNLNSVSFSDSENGIAVGDNGVIITYENKNWKLINKKFPGSLYTASFSDDGAWIAGGLECVNVPIMKMQIGKGKEVTNSIKLSAVITGISLTDPENGWAVGSPSALFHFDGQQWKKSDPGFSFPSPRAVFFSDPNYGLCVGYGGTVLIYSGGYWSMENGSTTRNLNGTTIIGNYYYAVGDYGTIISRKIDALNDQDIDHELKPDNLLIYPNPGDGVINFVIPAKEDYSAFLISITSSTGQNILHKELEFINSNYPYPIITSDLKNGIYLLKAIINNKTYSGKFVIRH